MHHKTLEALRRLLFLTKREAAGVLASSHDRPNGVSERAWAIFEAGDRLKVPADVEQQVLDMITWRQATINALREDLAKQGCLMWYETIDDYIEAQDDAGGYWRIYQSAFAEVLLEAIAKNGPNAVEIKVYGQD